MDMAVLRRSTTFFLGVSFSLFLLLEVYGQGSSRTLADITPQPARPAVNDEKDSSKRLNLDEVTEEINGMILAKRNSSLFGEEMIDVLAINVNETGENLTIFGHFKLPQDFGLTSTYCMWVNPISYSAYSTAVEFETFRVNFDSGLPCLDKASESYLCFDVVVELHSWSHICFSLELSQVTGFLNGQIIKPVRDPHRSNSSLYIRPSSSVTIHIKPLTNVLYFRGYLAGIQAFQGTLRKEHVNLVRFGRIQEVQLQHYDLVIDKAIPQVEEARSFALPYSDVIKQYHYKLLVFDSKKKYLQAYGACECYGGTLPVLDIKEHKEIIADIVPGSDFSNFWVMMSNDSHLEDLEKNSCSAFSIDKGLADVYSRNCKRYITQLFCMMPKGILFRLKGDSVIEDKTFAIIPDLDHQSITLESTRFHKGLWRGQSFQIEDRSGKAKLRLMSRGKHVIGRHVWQTKDNQLVNMSISRCHPEEFTCNNGQCISIEKRCDTHAGDCFDFSDEGSTCQAFYGPPSIYFSSTSPSNPKLSMEIRLKKIYGINENENNVQVFLLTTFRWRDTRLTFYNLNEDSTPLGVHHLESIWHPQLYFPTASYEDNLKISSNFRVQELDLMRQAPGTISQRDSYEVQEFSGENVVIKEAKVVDIAIQCEFHFEAFPFDLQLCVIPIQIWGDSRVKIDKRTLKVSSKIFNLPIYRVDPIRCLVVFDNSSSTRNKVKLAVLIRRRNEGFFMTMLGPCIVLEVLGHLSFLAFSTDEFNQRATTALSLLLVMTSLFSQTVTILPKSASPKAIDFWFFFFTLRFLFFFVGHCFVELQRHRLKKLENQERRYQGQLILKNKIGRCRVKMSLDAAGVKTHQEGESGHFFQVIMTRNAWKEPIETRQGAYKIQPEIINMLCLTFGVVADIIFIGGFVYFVQKLRSEYIDQFDKFEICS